MHSRLAEIEQSAERHRREGNIASRPRRFARTDSSRAVRPRFRLATRSA
jgi:hypothetical protein